MNRPDAFVYRCKRLVVRWLLAAAAVLASAGAVQAETVLRIVMNSDLKILDPIWNTAFVIRDHGYMVYDTLFATDAEGEIRPQMVDRTEISADKLVYTFTLRDKLKFTDGALKAVAKEAIRHKSGARGLRAILEQAMLNVMYEVPSNKNIKEIVISEDCIMKKEAPLIVYEKQAETA